MKRFDPRLPSPLDDRERLDWLRLLRSENVGPTTFRLLLDRFGSAADAISALPDLSARGGLRRPIRLCGRDEAEREMETAARFGARLLAASDPGFPPLLADLDGAPPLLYVAGQASVMEQPAVAIVGSRNCSALGRRLAAILASELGRQEFVVVSGLARGIDAAAHRASLATGTVAVLAGGHGNLYPPEHTDLAVDIARTGALLSEMPPDWIARAKDFPRRNRIVSGMCHGVVIVEAASRSGSLITARFALEQGREVFAVPGSPLDPRAEGTNRLIRDGATLTRSADDVLEVLAPILGASYRSAPPPGASNGPAKLAEIEDSDRRRVADAVGPNPTAIDDIVRSTGLLPGQVLAALIEFELAGRLERHPGQRVSLM